MRQTTTHRTTNDVDVTSLFATPRTAPPGDDLRAPARGGPARAGVRRSSGPEQDRVARALSGLLDLAADLDLTDPAWDEVASDAGRVTAELAAAGRIGRHLVVTDADPPVVVARLLAVAWRATRDALPCRVGGRHAWASSGTADG